MFSMPKRLYKYRSHYSLEPMFLIISITTGTVIFATFILAIHLTS